MGTITSILTGIGSMVGALASYTLYFVIGIAAFQLLQLIPGPPVESFALWMPVFAYTMKLNFILPVVEIMDTILLTIQLITGFLAVRLIIFITSFFVPQINTIVTFGHRTNNNGDIILTDSRTTTKRYKGHIGY